MNALDSTSANLVEGYYSNSTGEFIRFSSYVRRSCAEVKDRMEKLFRRSLINNEDFVLFDDKAITTGYIIDRLIIGLKKKRDQSK